MTQALPVSIPFQYSTGSTYRFSRHMLQRTLDWSNGNASADSAPHQSPQRLVVVLVRRLDDRHVAPVEPTLRELSGDGDSPRPTAADQNLMTNRFRHHRNLHEEFRH